MLRIFCLDIKSVVLAVSTGALALTSPFASAHKPAVMNDPEAAKAVVAPPALQPPAIIPTRCAVNAAKLDSAFPSGSAGTCSTSGDARFSLLIAPEVAPPINCSAWYAFRLTPQKAGTVTIDLNYTACGHRYWPKVSTDGVNWDYLPKKSVTIEDNQGIKKASIKVKLGKQPVFVAGQEIIVGPTYDAWLANLSQSPDAALSQLGLSAEKRPIPMLRIKQAGSAPHEQVVLIGRQHPPEVSGALAMFPFVEAILSDDPVAKRFRARFETVVVPFVNPDGVARGHWRHNTGGTDLNRDWGPFVQPETKLLEELLKQIAMDPHQNLRLFIDFHSTQKDVVYTLPDSSATKPADYTRLWLDRYQERMPGYKVKRDPAHNVGSAVSKAYVYDTYQVPTATFELGDETDRKLIKKIGHEAALAMMETLLASPTPDQE